MGGCLAGSGCMAGWDCVGAEGGDAVSTSEAESCAPGAALRVSNYGMSDVRVSNSR